MHQVVACIARGLDHRRLVVVHQILVAQQLFVVLAEALHMAFGNVRCHAQRGQHAAAHLQAGAEHFAERLGRHVHQAPRMLAVACTRQHRRVRVQPTHHAHRAQVGLRVVHGDHEHIDVLAARRTQHLRPGRVAVVQLVAEAAQVGHGVRVRFQRHERHLLRGQQARDHLAETAHAGDQHLRPIVRRHLVGLGGLARCGLLLTEQLEQRDHQQRRDRHRQADDRHQPVVVGVAQQVRALCFIEHHEGELAAQPQYAAQQQRLSRTEFGDTPDHVEQAELDHQQDRHAGSDQPRFGGDAVQIDAHPHRDEEQAQQQPLERLDLRFQLVPELRIGQQHAGQERAQAGAEAGFLHEPGGAQHHQQCGGGEYFRAAGARDDAEHLAQHRSPAQDHHGQRTEGHGSVFPAKGLVLHPAQQRDGRQQRNRDQVLEQQDGEPEPAMVAVDRLVLGQQLQAHRGG